MIETTIGDILSDKALVLKTEDHYIYVVRDGATVFYVGQSRCPLTRLLGHMGQGEWVFPGGVSSVGEMIRVNRPQSLDWQIELLTLADCNAADVNTAEGALIHLYAPLLNRQGKRRRSAPLPKRYKTPWPAIANEGVRLA